MASYEATVRWRRGADETFTDNRYSRAHEWAFDGGALVRASSSPQVVRVPLSDPTGIGRAGGLPRPRAKWILDTAGGELLRYRFLLASEELPNDDYRFPSPRLRGEHSEATLAQCAELARSRYG
jgi:hypothetical protein